MRWCGKGSGSGISRSPSPSLPIVGMKGGMVAKIIGSSRSKRFHYMYAHLYSLPNQVRVSTGKTGVLDGNGNGIVQNDSFHSYLVTITICDLSELSNDSNLPGTGNWINSEVDERNWWNNLHGLLLNRSEVTAVPECWIVDVWIGFTGHICRWELRNHPLILRMFRGVRD